MHPAIKPLIRVTGLGKGHTIRIHRDRFELSVKPGLQMPVFITPKLEVVMFEESNEKCGEG